MPVNIDANLSNADWTKKTWDLPTTEAEFLTWLINSGMSVEHFKTLPVYRYNKDKFEFLSRLGVEPIPDFKPGLLSDLMSQQPMRKK